jgi:hypothetical protein
LQQKLLFKQAPGEIRNNFRRRRLESKVEETRLNAEAAIAGLQNNQQLKQTSIKTDSVYSQWQWQNYTIDGKSNFVSKYKKNHHFIKKKIIKNVRN